MRHSWLELTVVLAIGMVFSEAVGVAQTTGTAPAKPIGTGSMNAPDLTIDLMAVERKAGVLTVKWAVRNSGAKDTTINFALVGPSATTYVVDEENGAKYYVLTDRENHGLASEHENLGGGLAGILDTVKSGQSLRYWMKLPAPPAEVKSIGIFLTAADPFESIPITEKQ